MVGKLLQQFLDEHGEATNNRISRTTHTDIITHEIPEVINTSLNMAANFKVYGSVGAGQWAETPWVAILNRAITETTQTGYYVCYLIDPKNRVVFLSLAVGWTQFSDQFSKKDALAKIDAYSHYLVDRLTGVPTTFSRGHIDLSAEGALTQGYEVGQILSKSYSYDELSNEDMLTADLTSMLKLYKELANVAGDNILNVDYSDVTSEKKPSGIDTEINIATLRPDTGSALSELIELVNAEPPRSRLVLLNKIIRKPKFALYVKEKVDYICEICGRKPFIQSNGKPYAEADHIEALGDHGVDHPGNMRCLCAQCHAVITHGSDDEKQKLLGQNIS